MLKHPKGSKKLLNAWALYDWANSVYALTITTAVLPPYFSSMTGGREGKVYGLQNSTLYAYILAFAFISVAIANPILSSIADTDEA